MKILFINKTSFFKKNSNPLYSLVILLVVTVLFTFVGCQEKGEGFYYCPMHPDYTSDHPGDCPICGMKLVARKEKIQTKDHSPELFSNHSNHKAQNHPKIGNDPKISDNDIGKSINKENDQTSFLVSPEQQKAIGVKLSPAKSTQMTSRILSSGGVVYDPDLYEALVEYREARRLGGNMDRSFLEAAKQKLVRLGLDKRDISIWSNKNPEIFISGRSGKYVYVFTQVFERDLPNLSMGKSVETTATSYPGKIFSGRVIGWFRLLDEKNRSTQAWIEILDPERKLQPRMYTETKFSIPHGKVLLVPRNAVIHTGLRNLVYVKISEDRFRQVVVSTGEETEESIQILSGLSEGDLVVVGANFLLDSEARMQIGGNL
jgi:Cu(I)/Ag(I) efflux system membrane fusion protein